LAGGVVSKPKDGVIIHDADKIHSYEVSRRMKSLNTTEGKLLSVIKKARIAIHQAECDIADAKERLLALRAEAATLESKGVVVTEHALLRYLARYKGIDLDAVANEIKYLPEDAFIQRGNSIVTIVEGNT
jgi:hypothetical protein